MILSNATETSIYPFCPGATLSFGGKQLFPTHCVLDICLYPRTECNPPYYISSINKSNVGTVLVGVSDGNYEEVCTIVFSKTQLYGFPAGWTAASCVGYALQGGNYVGCMYGSENLSEYLDTIEYGLIELSDASFPIDPYCIHIRPVATTRGDVVIDGYIVNSVSWDNKNIHVESGEATIKAAEIVNSLPINVNKVTINGVSVEDCKDIYIIPEQGNGIRVKNSDRITIGRLSDL